MFPISYHNIFLVTLADDERRQFTTRQDNVPQEDLLAMLRNQLGSDNAQSQRFFEEGTRLLQERTGQQGLFDNSYEIKRRAAFSSSSFFCVINNY